MLRQITNVAAGTQDTDAVNIAQLKGVALMAEDSLQWDQTREVFSAKHKGEGPNKITDVANGTISSTSNDAVNGSQLFGLVGQVNNIGDRVTNIENNFNGAGIKFFQSNSTKTGAIASGTDAVAMGPKSIASGTGSIASGNEAKASGAASIAMGENANASADGSVAIGANSSDGGRGAETYKGKYSGEDNTTTGTVSVGNADTGENRTISNVADGKEANDVVNLGQLDGAVAEAKNIQMTRLVI